jgi:hypothetical protein
MPTCSPFLTPLGGQVVGQAVGPVLELGVGEALPLGHQILTIRPGVDGGLEEVSQVEFHPRQTRTSFDPGDIRARDKRGTETPGEN